MLFGHVHGDPNDYEPSRINFNAYRKQIEVFVCDRWQLLGEYRIRMHGLTAEISMQQVDETIDQRAIRDDGFAERVEWGVMLN